MNGDIRYVEYSGLGGYANQFERLAEDAANELGKYGKSLENLVGAGIIEGAQVQPLNNAYDTVQSSVTEVQEKSQTFSNFIREDVINKTSDLDDRHSSQLQSLIDNLPAFRV